MTELIVLAFLKDLPQGAGYQMRSPLEEAEVAAWAEQYKATRVYYWRRTKSAFIPLVRQSVAVKP